jgi:hypothetical protein
VLLAANGRGSRSYSWYQSAHTYCQTIGARCEPDDISMRRPDRTSFSRDVTSNETLLTTSRKRTLFFLILIFFLFCFLSISGRLFSFKGSRSTKFYKTSVSISLLTMLLTRFVPPRSKPLLSCCRRRFLSTPKPLSTLWNPTSEHAALRETLRSFVAQEVNPVSSLCVKMSFTFSYTHQ